MIDYAALESRLIAECDAAIAEEWKLVPGQMFDGARGCCPLGAAARNQDAGTAVAECLGVDIDTTIDIARGFDGGSIGEGSRAYAIGARLRARYCEVKNA